MKSLQSDEVEALLEASKNPVKIIGEDNLFEFVELSHFVPDTMDRTIERCQKAIAMPKIAGICVSPQFVTFVKAELAAAEIKIITAINETDISAPKDEVVLNIEKAIADGVDEIEIICPHELILDEDHALAQDFVRSCKVECGDQVCLKVIIETDKLGSEEKIYQATKSIISAGANFIAIATNKIKEEAIAAMLLAIKDSDQKVGIKIKEKSAAEKTICMIKKLFKNEWLSVDTFRLEQN